MSLIASCKVTQNCYPDHRNLSKMAISGHETGSQNGMINDADSRIELGFVGKNEKSPMEFIGPDIANGGVPRDFRNPRYFLIKSFL